MTTRGLILVLLSAGITVASNLMLRSGIDLAGGFPDNFNELPSALLRLAKQPLFDLGLVFYAIAALIWFRIVASEPLSTAYPLLVSLTFILVTLGATILFNESLSWRKLVGLAIILMGIFIISRD